MNHVGSNARVGQGDYMVVEADESDRSFLLLAPVVAIVTNIDREHLDQYSSLEEIQRVFLQFVNRVPFYGQVILCVDDHNVEGVLAGVKRPVVTYGTSANADLVIHDVRMEGLASYFRLRFRGEEFGECHLPAPPGIHNIRNAAAAVAAGLYLNLPPDLIRLGLRHADRRLRASSGGNSSHARSRARMWVRAPDRFVSAASLLADPAPVGRISRRVPARGCVAGDGYLCRG